MGFIFKFLFLLSFLGCTQLIYQPDRYLHADPLAYGIAFNEFYYDSSWGTLEFPLHPNMDESIFNYGRNSHLEWLDVSNYDMIVRGYDELIREYQEYSAQTPVQISHTYRKLREVWRGINPDLAYKVKAEKLFKEILTITNQKGE